MLKLSLTTSSVQEGWRVRDRHRKVASLDNKIKLSLSIDEVSLSMPESKSSLRMLILSTYPGAYLG